MKMSAPMHATAIAPSVPTSVQLTPCAIIISHRAIVYQGGSRVLLQNGRPHSLQFIRRCGRVDARMRRHIAELLAFGGELRLAREVTSLVRLQVLGVPELPPLRAMGTHLL